MTHQTAVVVALAALAICQPGAAVGQTISGGSNRPFRGLFGPSPQPRSGDTLDFMVSAYGAVQDNGPRITDASQGSSEPLKGGTFGGATASLTYSHRGDRVSFGLSGGSAVSYQRTSSEPFIAAYNMGAFSGVTLDNRTTINVGQTVLFSPYYRSVFGVQIDPTQTDPATGSPADYGVFRADSWTYHTTARMTRRLGVRSTFDVNYRLRLVDFKTNALGVNQQDVGAHYGRELSQHATLRAGYRYQVGTSDFTLQAHNEPVALHYIDLGVNYSRPLSLSRRTTVSFSTGSALIQRARDNLVSGNSSPMFRVLGNVGLQHEIGRSWTARVGYNRDVGFVEGFTDPLLSDSVAASIIGLVTRGINVLASATYSHATPANASTSNIDHEAFGATARLQKALTHNVALFGQYVFYQTNRGSAVPLPTAIEEFDRHVVRGGLTWWLPILR
jgi:hypothetical protein